MYNMSCKKKKKNGVWTHYNMLRWLGVIEHSLSTIYQISNLMCIIIIISKYSLIL